MAQGSLRRRLASLWPGRNAFGRPTKRNGDDPARGSRLRLLESLGLKGSTGAEIGVFRGDFSGQIIDALQPKKFYLIDPWENFDDPGLVGSWYHEDSSNRMEQIFHDVMARFAAPIQAGQVEVIRGRSREAASRFSDGEFDFVYIDGDHRFEGVLADLKAFGPKIKPGGMIILDDHSLGKWWGDGVIRALNTFLGDDPSGWRVFRVVGNQVVIKKID